MTIYALEGIDYSGKSTAAETLIAKFGMIHHTLVLPEEEKSRINSLPLMDRFLAYLDLNKEIYPLAKQHKPSDKVFLERCWLSTLAYHNVYLGKRFEEDKNIYRTISSMRFDKFLLMMTNRQSLEERMLKRKPAHKFETDIDQLLMVQDEYVRLLDKLSPEMSSNYTIIDNSTNSKEDLVKLVCGLEI